jgi:hypothetical protein
MLRLVPLSMPFPLLARAAIGGGGAHVRPIAQARLSDAFLQFDDREWI